MEFHSVKQVHGIDIVDLKSLPCDADGLMVTWENFNRPLAIKTADCLPILIEGNAGVIFLHAGWRGLAAGILKKSQIKDLEPQRVFIGPSIHKCCFEVSADFAENFSNKTFFTKVQNHYYFDLQQEARRQLRETFPNLLVETSPICTSCNSELHSYRRDQTSERNWNLYIKG